MPKKKKGTPKAEPKPVGRPSKYNEKIAAEIIDRIANGEYLDHICRDDHMPDAATVRAWNWKHEAFHQAYVKARYRQMHGWADDIIKIADDSGQDTYTEELAPGVVVSRTNNEAINRARLRIDTRKWVMAKLAPSIYAERTEVSHSGNINVTPVINVAGTMMTAVLAPTATAIESKPDEPE